MSGAPKERPQFACPKCKQGYSTLSNQTKHTLSCDGTKKSTSCETCGKSFPNMGALSRHECQTSTICPICGKKFSHVSNLRRHTSAGCQGGSIPDAPITEKSCSKCSATGFTTTFNFNRHESTCSGVAFDDQIKCGISHEHTIVKRKFSNFDEAVQWVEDMEFKVEFRVRSSGKNYKYFQCRRNRSYKEKTSTCGNVECSAGFSITGSEQYGLVKGCVHHSHPPLKGASTYDVQTQGLRGVYQEVDID